MSLTVGVAHGPFAVLEPIGRGSLGEIFAAHDTDADRDVTLEVVPADLASDPARVADLRQAVAALASVDHPNVSRCFGLESSLDPPVVVSGPTSGLTVAAMVRAHGVSGARAGDGDPPDESMPRIGLPLTEALFVAHQVARGLEAVHARGLVHRRLHPATVRIGSDGVIRLGGFGFAVPCANDPDALAHCSPEQVKGQAADRRSDVWAFGVLLYEMLAGVGPFLADDAAGTEAAVLRGDPEWSALPLDTPLAVRRLLRACLETKPDARPADLASARRALESYLARRVEPDVAPITAAPVESASDTRPPIVVTDEAVRSVETARLGAPPVAPVDPDPASPIEFQPVEASDEPAVAGPARAPRHLGLVAALAIGAVASGGLLWWLRPPVPEHPSRYVVSVPPSASLDVDVDSDGQLAISSDGRLLVYTVRHDGQRRAYLRPADALEGWVVSEARDPESLFFSPDGRWLGYSAADGEWSKVPVEGGEPRRITSRQGEARGGSWSADGSIIFAERRSGLFRVSDGGGIRQALTTLDPTRGETGHYWPSLLPGDRAVLFSIIGGPGESQAAVAALDLDTRTIRRLVPGGRNAQYVSSGHLVYSAGPTVYAIAFDPERLEVRGHPVPVLDGVMTRSNRSAEFHVSSAGVLTYVAGDARRIDPRVLAWVDLAGVEEVLAVEPGGYRAARISPDGSRIAIERRDPDGEIVIWDVARARLSPLTTTPGNESSPAWTPDGERVTFHSEREPQGIFWTRADGTGPVERLLSGAGAWPFSWSRDGQRLVVGTGGALAARDAAMDVAVTGTAGDATVEPLVATVSDERNAEISPDGRWLAYESSQSGRPEIYARPFPDPSDGRWAVSTAGGRQPVWSPDGDSLFYATPDGTIVRVEVDGSDALTIGEPTALFSGPYALGWAGRSFDVSPDGERLLMIRHDEATRLPANVVIVEAWAGELGRRTR